MPRRSLIGSAAVVAGLTGAVAGVRRSAWAREVEWAEVRVLACGARANVVTPEVFEAQWRSLPTPVARYLAFALAGEQPRPCSAHIRWRGEFRMRPQARWSRFSATQRVAIDPPALAWHARIAWMPLLPVQVLDGYRDGTGSMRAAVGGVIPVVDQRGSRQMARSALARWLGEAVWFPMALLPGGPVRWAEGDDNTATATVRDGDVSASAEFRFAPTGEVRRVSMLRYRDDGGSAVLTPFEAQLSLYERHAGVMVPGDGEAAWMLPEGRFTFWRARPESIEYPIAASANRSASPGVPTGS